MDITEKERRLRQKIGFGLAVLFSVASLCTVLYWISQVSNSIQSLNWPGANGVVQSSEVIRSFNGNRSATYFPEIRYTYDVDGRTYKADKLQFVQDGTGEQWARKKALSYPVNAVVEVAYNPADPQTAVLEPGAEIEWYLMITAVALAFTAVFFGLAWLFIKDVRKMQRWGRGLV